MTNKELKTLFQKDIETIKTLDIGIIPAKQYYLGVLKGIFILLSLFMALQFAGCILAIKLDSWEYIGNPKRVQSERVDEWSRGTPTYMTATGEHRVTIDEALQRYAHEDAENHQIRVAKMVLGVIFSSLFMIFFFLGKIKNYVIFKYEIKPFLKTGDYLTNKSKQALKVFLISFGLSSLLFIPLFDQDMTFFAALASFIFSAVIISIVINMETSRIGVSVITDVIAEFLSKSKLVKT